METADPRAPLSLTGRHWQWPEPVAAAAGPHGLPGWAAALLQRRGMADPAAVAAYLTPSLQSLADPSDMADMDAAVARIVAALAARESIVVYGDYDVDGVCSTAVLVEFLRGVGATVAYYIPDRRAEGYGLNEAAMRTLAACHRLIITVDCGITAVAEVALATALGACVIVVDHHQVGPTLPPAVANLDPHRPDCPYPFKGMCAAGVTFMLVVALRRALRARGHFAAGREPDLRPLLDLVAVATVADMVPMQQCNRALTAAGLRQLGRAPRPGLRALCAVAGIAPAQVGAADLGFKLGPRINARGRMHSAGLAVELMLTRDPERAATLAAALDAANLERRRVERDTVAAALRQVEAAGLGDDDALVVCDDAWHPGVLGLVASRLAARFHRPTLVIGAGGKGSGRSVEGIDLHAALTTVAPLLERFGGHPAAAGVTVTAAHVAPLRAALAAAVARARGGPPCAPPLRPDVEVEAARVDLGLAGLLGRLAPFGQANPEPLFVARALRVAHRQVVGDAHLKVRFAGGTDAIGFGLGGLCAALPEHVEAAFFVERNVFRGSERVQMRVQDLRPAAADRRAGP